MKTQTIASRKQVVAQLAREFANGQHQVKPQDLPFEIQFRTGCSWGRALTDANAIWIAARK